MNSFNILQEYKALEDLMNETDPETGEFLNSEDDIKEYVEQLQQDKNTKLNNIQDLKLSNTGAISTLDEKIKKLQARKKSIQSLNDRLSDIQVMLLNGEKQKTDEYTFSFRKAKSINITDETKVFERGLYTKITKTADKTAIKKDIIAGKKVLGAELVEKTSLSVR